MNIIINHTSAAIPTRLYTMLLANVAGPKINATKSKPNIPIKPQFNAPINVSGFKT